MSQSSKRRNNQWQQKAVDLRKQGYAHTASQKKEKYGLAPGGSYAYGPRDCWVHQAGV